jgi:hypothetical protein
MSEKIGIDILGYQSMPRMTAQKKKEIEAKLKEQKNDKEKATENEETQKLPELPIPNDLHIPKPGEHGWDEIEKEAKDVHVSEHKRGRPKKKQEVEVV